MKTLKNLLSVLSAAAVAAGLTVILSNTVFAAEDIEINETNFPDAIFRNWILAQEYGQDGVLTEEEIAGVKEIDVSDKEISDLSGIEYFIALEELILENNNLTSIDMSKNTALEKLYICSNRLTSINVSQNTALKSLRCDDNRLTSIDVSKNTKLEELLCSYNQLTSLDLRKNTELIALECIGIPLTYLDLSKNTALNKVYCQSDTISIIFLAKEPDEFICDYGVEKIVVNEGDIAISDVNFPDENFRDWILAQGFGQDDVLTEEEIADVSEICVDNKDISDLRGIEYFTELEKLICYQNQLTSFDVSKNTALKHLECDDNELTSLDLSKNIALELLICRNNPLKSLDVSNNTALSFLECSETYLTSLDVSKNTALAQLYCDNNRLKSLDVSKNTELCAFDCSCNELTSLELCKNANFLGGLQCNGNQLTSLDLSYITVLNVLDCSDNQLTSLDLRKNTQLKRLNCCDNQLANLDLSVNTELYELHCENNQFNKIYLSKESDEFYIFECDDGVERIVLTASDWTCKVDWEINKSDPSKTTATAVFECTKAGAEGYTVSEPMAVTNDITPATCEDKGSAKFTAYLFAEDSRTSEEIYDRKDVELPATGHSWGDWTVTQKATVTSEGEETRVCKNDPSHKETRKIAKLTPTPTPSPSATPTAAAKPTSKPTAAPTKAATVTLKLDKSKADLVCGKTLVLKATLKGSKDKITWKSSDKKIATVDANGKVTTKMAGAVTITATAAGKSAECKVAVLYKDVTNTSDFWYAPTNYLTAKGVVKGYDNQTKFKPANDCTRAQMLTFMWRLQGEPAPKAKTCKFNDVKSSDYFFKPVIWAVEKGITTGYSDGTFKPQNVCTRAQTVTFLWRMAGKPKAGISKNPFSDVGKNDYFYNAVLWASGKKIVAGYSNGTFQPQGKCLRRQMVTFLYKYDKFVNGKG